MPSTAVSMSASVALISLNAALCEAHSAGQAVVPQLPAYLSHKKNSFGLMKQDVLVEDKVSPDQNCAFDRCLGDRPAHLPADGTWGKGRMTTVWRTFRIRKRTHPNEKRSTCVGDGPLYAILLLADRSRASDKSELLQAPSCSVARSVASRKVGEQPEAIEQKGRQLVGHHSTFLHSWALRWRLKLRKRKRDMSRLLGFPSKPSRQ